MSSNSVFFMTGVKWVRIMAALSATLSDSPTLLGAAGMVRVVVHSSSTAVGLYLAPRCRRVVHWWLTPRELGVACSRAYLKRGTYYVTEVQRQSIC